MKLCRYWNFDNVTYASIKCTNFNLLSGCDNFQCSSHLCLLFLLFILSLLDPVDHQSLNHQTFTPTDSLRAISDVRWHIQHVFSALFTHWRTFTPAKRISTSHKDFKNCASMQPCYPAKLLSQQGILCRGIFWLALSKLLTIIKIVSKQNHISLYHKSFFLYFSWV